MRVVVKTFPNLTASEYRRVYRMNFGWGGDMQRFLTMYKDDERFIAIMLKEGEEILGWASLVPTTPLEIGGGYYVTDWGRRKSKYGVQLWVKPKYRKRGYGKRLMDEAVKLDPTPFVWPWNSVNGKLFSKYKVVMSRDDRETYL